MDGRVVLLVHFYASLRGGGHPFCVVAACGRWGAFSHSTPKEVCVPAGQNYHHEIGACWRMLGDKSIRKKVVLKSRKGGRKYGLFVVMCTFFFLNVDWLVGEPSICHPDKYLSHFLTKQQKPSKTIYLDPSSCCSWLDLLSRPRVLFCFSGVISCCCIKTTPKWPSIPRLGPRTLSWEPQDLQLGFHYFQK